MKAGERSFKRTRLPIAIIVFLILFLFNGQHVALSASDIKRGSLTEKYNCVKIKIRCGKSNFSSLCLFNICEGKEENECLAINIKDQSENPFLIEDKNNQQYLSYRIYFFKSYPLYLLNQSFLI